MSRSMNGRKAPHSWVWQLALPFARRVQVCLREGCDWARRPDPLHQHGWEYQAGPGLPWERLESVPTCRRSGELRPSKQGGKGWPRARKRRLDNPPLT